MPCYAITGANGFIACHLVKQLSAEGHKIRCTVRDLNSAAHLESLGAEVFHVANFNDSDSLQSTFKGVDGVFHMAAVHPDYGFAETAEGRAGILNTAVEGTLSVLKAVKAAGVERVVLTSSLAAIECGNDEGPLTEAMWSRPEVYDSKMNLENTQWATHYSYVKSKVEQEKAAITFAQEMGLDLRVVVPGNLCIGPIASESLNGTMKRIKDIVSGTNTLKGAADLAIVHVFDVVSAHVKCMTTDSATGRYLVASNMVPIEEIFATLKELYPQLPVASLDNMDIASGMRGKARKIESRVGSELDIKLHSYKDALRHSVDDLLAKNFVVSSPVPAC